MCDCMALPPILYTSGFESKWQEQPFISSMQKVRKSRQTDVPLCDLVLFSCILFKSFKTQIHFRINFVVQFAKRHITILCIKKLSFLLVEQISIKFDYFALTSEIGRESKKLDAF